jgi:hypothetical protein
MGAAGFLLQGPGGSPSQIVWGRDRKKDSSMLYLAYDSEDPPPTKKLEDLVRYCEREHLHLLVGCDSNAHHSAWGSTNCNSTGEALMKFLSSSNLEILNRGNQPTFCNAVTEEVLDVILPLYGYWHIVDILDTPYTHLMTKWILVVTYL